MSFATTMTALKDKVDGLIANRVAKFAYTQQAYNSNDVNGVTTYDFNNEQNIPASSASVLKVNETVLTKGWRTQASAITRMLMNHFLGRTSYNLNKTVDFLKDFMLAIENNMGVAEGFATLDENAKLPVAQLTPDVVIDCGEWDADTNTPELEIGEGRKGDTYRVSVAGTQDLGEGAVIYRIGDTIMYNGSIWVKNGSGTVSSVNTVMPDDTGNVTVTGEDISTSSSDLTSIKNRMIEYAKLSFTNLLGRVWTFSLDNINYGKNYSGKIYYNNGYYYACLNHTSGANISNGVYKTTDGVNWEATNVTWGNLGGTSGYVYFIKHSPTNTTPNRFIIGTNAGLLYSDDYFNTYTWSNIRTDAYTKAPTDITDLGRIAINKENTSPLYSDDNGETWQKPTINTFGTVRGMSDILLQINNKLVVCCKLYSGREFYTLLVSGNCGATWTQCFMQQGTQIPVSASGWLTVKLIGSLVYAFATEGSSQQGVFNAPLSTFRFTLFNSSPLNVVVNDIVSITETGDATSGIMATASGLKYFVWNGSDLTVTNSNVTSGNYTQLAYANGIALACLGSGTSVKLKYSTDEGKTWADCNIPNNTPYVINGYINGVWHVATDSSSTDNPHNYFSTDGINFYVADYSLFRVSSTGVDNKFSNMQLVHNILFTQTSFSILISSVDTLIERGWVNID